MIDVTGGEAPWTGGPLGDRIWCQVCPNPGPMTLDGTNSWILSNPGSPEAVVIDSGPLDEGHLQAVLDRVVARGQRVGLALLTHWHEDHTGSAERFAELTGAPVRGAGRGQAFTDGEVIGVEGIELQALLTPGHTRDSVSFFVYSAAAGESELEGIITGDTIAGRHTTMISETDGDLGDYLDSLTLLEEQGEGVRLLPGHGPEGDDVSEFARKYLERRTQRLEQIREVIREHGVDADINTFVDAIYDDVDPVLRGAAEQSTRVALRYIRNQG